MKRRTRDSCAPSAWLHAAAVAFGLATFAAAQEPVAVAPQEIVETLHRALVAAARSPDVDERYRQLRPVVVATHDLPYIAQFALRRQWPTLSATERERFVAAFEELSVMTYARRFANVSEATFSMTGTADAGAGRTTVTASIARDNDTPIPLEYLLHEADGRWRIINIVADGVSDLALKRAEYQSALAQGSLDDLIARLEEQTARLR